VFEPVDPSTLKTAPKAFTYKTDAHGHTYEVYQHSYLHYGLNAARASLLELVGDDETKTASTPCLPSYFSTTLSVSKDKYYTATGTVDSSFEACYQQMKQTLKLDTPCSFDSCSFGGQYQPEPSQFSEEWHIFSFFYDRAEDIGMPSTVTPLMYREQAERYCSAAEGSSEALNELAKNPQLCLDLTYIYTLLHDGFRFAENQTFHLTKKINGFETGWYLGAMISTLEEEQLICRV